MFIGPQKQTMFALREECHVYSPQTQTTLALREECHVYSQQKHATFALLTECGSIGARAIYKHGTPDGVREHRCESSL